MFSCDDFLAEFGDYLEGDLSPNLRKELELHLAQCSTCQVIVDSTLKTLKVVTESGEFDLSEELPQPAVDRIMAKLRTNEKE